AQDDADEPALARELRQDRRVVELARRRRGAQRRALAPDAVEDVGLVEVEREALEEGRGRRRLRALRQDAVDPDRSGIAVETRRLDEAGAAETRELRGRQFDQPDEGRVGSPRARGRELRARGRSAGARAAPEVVGEPAEERLSGGERLGERDLVADPERLRLLDEGERDAVEP